SPALITTLMSTYSGVQLLSAPLWGRLSDRIGRRPVILVSTMASVVAYLWLSSADALWLLFAARAIQGLAGGNISVAQAYIADITTPENRAKGMGGLGAALGLGFVLGPAIGGLLAGGDPVNVNVALPSLAAAGLSAVALLIGIFRLKESLTPALRAQAHKGPGRIAQIRSAFARPRLRILMILFFSTTFAFAGMETTFGLWAFKRLDWGPRQVGEVFAVVGIVLVLVQGGLIGRITKRFGEARALFAGTIGIGIGLALLAAATGPVMGIVASCWLALGMGLASPSTSAMISQEASASEQGGILGVNQSIGSFARIAGPFVAGQAFELGGPSAPYMVGAAVMVISACLAFQIVRRRSHDAVSQASA
ncbi:MAG: transporter, family, tetracycline resistance protein, partial [Aliidongia sp.]|nr:transporter, family, tetracycline resistance protein [Aliidongia sp.]